MGYSDKYNKSSIIIDDVPYTVSDGGIAKDQPHVGKKPYTATSPNKRYTTYNFSTPNGYGFIKAFQFTSGGPITGLNFKGIGESLGSLSSLLLTIMLLSMVKLLSGTTSLLIGDLFNPDPDSKARKQ